MTSKDQEDDFEDELADDENGDPKQQLSLVLEGLASITKKETRPQERNERGPLKIQRQI